MQKKTDEIWQEQFKKAQEDELSAESILKHRDGSPSTVCFLSHQMAEKCLKGLLVYNSQDYPKVHDLKRIATLLEKFASNIFDLDNDFTVLNKRYVVTRYPADMPEFSWQDAEEAYAAAKKIKDFVLGKVK